MSNRGGTETVDGAAYFAAERLRWTEEQFQAAVLREARERGWLCYHTRDSRRSAAGFPDLVMVRRERLIFAELKREKGRVSAEQWAWLEAISDVDQPRVDVHLWRPSDWAEIEAVLR